jgi:signal transduction histidine kinase
VIAVNVEETRRLVWDLREQPTALEPALAEMVRRAAASVPAQFHVDGAEPPLPPSVRHELIRIAQEALNNALAHARAGRIDVRLGCGAETVALSVSDDGVGFDPPSVPAAAAGHFGLTGMRERAAAIGVFSLHSRPGQGTRIEVVVRRGKHG